MLDITAGPVDVQLITAAPSEAERDRIRNVRVEMLFRHRNRDHDFRDLAVSDEIDGVDRHLRFYVDAGVTDIVEMLPDLPGKPPVARHVISLRGIDRHAEENALGSDTTGVHALRDVRRLLADMLRHQDVAATDGVLHAELLLVGRRVADQFNRVSDERSDLALREISLAGDFTAERDVLILDLNLQRKPRLRVAFQIAIEDEARDEIREFVRVSE